jgi:hypothetical protein
MTSIHSTVKGVETGDWKSHPDGKIKFDSLLSSKLSYTPLFLLLPVFVVLSLLLVFPPFAFLFLFIIVVAFC